MVQSVPVYLTSVRCSCIQFSASPYGCRENQKNGK